MSTPYSSTGSQSDDRRIWRRADPTTAPSPAAAAEEAAAATHPKPPRRALYGLILGGLTALGPLSTDMYLPALPALSADLGATMAQTQVTLSAGILGLALGQVVAGPSSDALGRRWPLRVGLAAFVLASLLCIVAPSVAALTALRFIQGATGAAGIAIALAMVSDLYSGLDRARVFALLTQISGLAPIVAPILGGQLLVVTTWRGVFATLALIGLGLLLAAALGLGETLPPDRRLRGGAGASLAAVRELVADRHFVGPALASGFAFAAGIVYISASPFVLGTIYGVSPQALGLVFGLNALGLVVMAQVSGRLVGRLSPHALLTWGGAAIALGGLSLLGAVLGGLGLVGVLLSLFVVVASLGLIAPNATTLALGGTLAAGSASALLGVIQFSIGAVAAPLVGLGGAASAVPMAAAIAAFGSAALVMAVAVRRSAR